VATPTDGGRAGLPLTAAHFHILLALADGEKHGYAIMREADELSLGRVRLGPGTLYGAIKRLLEAGLIEESDDRPDPGLDDQRRRYYRLTNRGERMASAEAERLANLAEVAQQRNLISWKPASLERTAQ
jgi:DNA-binding PadR family transcriptional regulator